MPMKIIIKIESFLGFYLWVNVKEMILLKKSPSSKMFYKGREMFYNRITTDFNLTSDKKYYNIILIKQINLIWCHLHSLLFVL